MTERKLYYSTENFHLPVVGDRPAIEAIREVINAFECIAPEDDCIYLSSEITTGERFYNLLRRHGVRSREQLREKLGSGYQDAWRRLMDENLDEGHAFFQRMYSEGHRNLINPGPFFGPGWQQEHYLYLWEWIIVHKCRETRFNAGWGYSNGCTLEYAISLRKGIPRRHPDGQPLEAPEAVAQIEAALADLDASGIDAATLRLNLQRVKEVSGAGGNEQRW